MPSIDAGAISHAKSLKETPLMSALGSGKRRKEEAKIPLKKSMTDIKSDKPKKKSQLGM